VLINIRQLLSIQTQNACAILTINKALQTQLILLHIVLHTSVQNNEIFNIKKVIKYTIMKLHHDKFHDTYVSPITLRVV
jgi:hypothetical protein